jgi:hypothetical protein
MNMKKNSISLLFLRYSSFSFFCHSELSKQKHPMVPCASANFCFQLLVKCWVWSDSSLSVHASRVHHVLGYLVRHSSTLESLLISIIQHRELCPWRIAILALCFM